ncbi:MAG: ABC transporter ATP-binding protein [Gemmatimonadaceae bacterium]
MIKLQQVRMIYAAGSRSVTALDGVSLEIEAGEFVAIVGTSGSGKTTLLQILGALDVPSEGAYLLNGVRVDGLPDAALSALRNRTIGFVFQNFNLLPRTTALENVLTPGLYADAPPSVADAENVMERVGMLHRRTHYPSEMSGGEQQRVAIARALVMRPSLVLADEPTGNLDATTAQQIMDLLADLHRAGLTIVLVTHDPLIAARAERTITISDGRIVSDGLRNSFSSAPLAAVGKKPSAATESAS